MSTELGYDVFISEPISQNVTELLPNGDRAGWSPLSATLIHGRNDAFWPIRRSPANRRTPWATGCGQQQNLTHLRHPRTRRPLVTAGMLAERFGAQIIATPAPSMRCTAMAMREPCGTDSFPARSPKRPLPRCLRGTIELSLRVPLDVVEVGHTDTDAASVLHVPDLDLVVAGDAVYNGVHLYLAESADGGRDKWRSAIDIVEALNPRWIVAGHKNKDLDDTATRAISQTRGASRAPTSSYHSSPRRWASSTPWSNAIPTGSTPERSGSALPHCADESTSSAKATQSAAPARQPSVAACPVAPMLLRQRF